MKVFRGIVLAALVSFAATSCGGMTQDAPAARSTNAKVSLTLPSGVSLKPGGAIASANPKYNAAKITSITLAITAADLTAPVTGDIPLDTLTLDLDVPSGPARTFTVAVATDTGLSFGGTQTVDLVANDSIDLAIAVTVINITGAPNGVSATAGNAQVAVSWTAVTGADSYNVYRSTASGTQGKLLGTSTTADYTDATAVNGTTCYYTITAMNPAGESAGSTQTSATPVAPAATVSAPGAPTGVSATAGNAQVAVSWTAVTGATSYNVYYSATAGTGTAGTKVTGATSAGAITGLTNGTTYYFVVTAVNAGGEGAFSTQVSATPQVPAPSAPTGVSPTASSGSVAITWTAVSGATSYKVYRSTSSGTQGSLLGTSSAANYTDSTATNGITYYYTVTAVNAGGEGTASSQVSATPQVPAPSAPGFWDGSATVGNGTVSVHWLASTGAATYNIYYGTTTPVTSGNSTKITGLTGTSSTVTGLTNGTLYYFAVSAVNAAGESALTQQVSGTPAAPPAAPTGVTAVSGDSRVTVSWSAVSGATYYNVYWSTTSGVTTANGTGIYAASAGTSYTHTGRTNGATYYYIVTAMSGVEGSASGEVSAKAGAGVNWTSRTSGTANTLYSVAWGNGMFVAVGAESAGRIRYSSDGITWSAANVASTNVTGNAMYNIVYAGAPAYFRSVGVYGTYDYSNDGITWYSRPQIGPDLYAFAYSSSMYVTVGQSTALYSSTNAISWTARTDPTGWGYNMLAATWSGTQFVAGGVAGTLLTSPDGITWTSRSTPTGNDIKGIAWGNGKLVAVVTAGDIMTSPDGITWTAQTSGTANALNGVVWNGTQFVAVGAAGTILTSPDGVTWTVQTSVTANALNGVAWDGTQYVAVGASGTILVSNPAFIGGAIQKPLASGGVVTTLAGGAGVTGSTDATGTAARFNWPDGITTDGTSLYVTDGLNNTIRKIVISTGAVTTLAGLAGTSGTTDATGTAARFNGPIGITTDGTNLYVADGGNHTIRQVVISTGVVTTLAGTAGSFGSTDATGTAALFKAPNGITTDGTNLYVADQSNRTIRKIVISTGVVTTLAGSAGVAGTTDATGTAARFYTPKGITTDGTNLYVADYDAPTIRKIVISTGVVTTLAGAAGTWDVLDGTGSAAAFYGPQGITTDGTNLYVTDYWNHNIRKIVIASAIVTTLAGSTGMAQGSTDGTGSAALFKQPYGITTDGTSLYVADYGNSTIRKIQ